MAARQHSSEKQQQYLIFDCSNHFVTAFRSKPEDHSRNFDHLKRVAIAAIENKIATKKTKSLIDLDTVSGGHSIEFEEDMSDEDSDAESLPCSQKDVGADVSDDKQCLNNLFHDEGTREKLKLLAGIVGADSMEPGIVLARAVTVFKDLIKE